MPIRKRLKSLKVIHRRKVHYCFAVFLLLLPAKADTNLAIARTLMIVRWKVRSNGVEVTNSPVDVLWTTDLNSEWQVALKNTTTNMATFLSTNKQAFFKIRQAQ
jgi:hypothetical protein